MEDWIIGVVIKMLRSAIWAITSFALTILDLSFDVVKAVLTIDIFTAYPSAMILYYGFVFATLGYFVFFKIIKIIFKYYVDEEFAMRLTVRSDIVLRRLFFLVVIAAAIPFLLKFWSGLISYIVANAAKIFRLGNSLKISDMMCAVGSITGNVSEVSKCPDLLSGNINAVNNAGDFTYFPDTFSMVIVALATGLSIKIMAILFLSITNRMQGIIYRLIISPYVLSQYIEENNHTLSTWLKLMFADLAMNFLQLIMILIAFNLPFAITLDNIHPLLTPLVRLGLFVGTLFGVLQAPGNFAQFLGSDASSATMQNNSHQIFSAVQNSAAQTANIIKTLGAGAIVMAGSGLYNNSQINLMKQQGLGVPSANGNNISSAFANFGNKLYQASSNHLKNSANELFRRR